MFLSRPSWPVVAAACLAASAVWAASAQERLQEPPDLSAGNASPLTEPTPATAHAAAPQDQGARTRMSESVRRYGRENRGGRVLGVESIRLNNRNLNRIKVVDDRGRVRVRIDDPQQTPVQPSEPPPLRPPIADGGD